MAKYRVLSIDGGGIRGLVTIVLLQRILATPGLEDFLDSIDLVAGTSTGGLLALGIAHQIPLDEMRDLYVNKGPKIFDDSWLDDLIDLGKLRGADYDIKPLRRELRRLFGETSLGKLKKRILVPAFDLDNEDPEKRTWKPKLFHREMRSAVVNELHGVNPVQQGERGSQTHTDSHRHGFHREHIAY